MNFAQMLMMEVQPLYDREVTFSQQSHQDKMAKLFRDRATQRYRSCFTGGRLRTTAEIGRELNLTKASSYLNMLERRGIVERVGTRPTGGTNPTILWKWIGD